MKRLFALGASDPEMQAIESLLNASGEQYCYAVGADGQRVHPGNAYKATDIRWPDGSGNGPAWGAVTHLVECAAFESACVRDDVVCCDHHRPGDRGYGRPAAKFVEASSIGQVLQQLATQRPLSWSTEFVDLGIRAETAEIVGNHVVCGESDWDGPCPTSAYVATIPHEIMLVAAADHCLAAAYRGECPGIDPDELMAWRIKTRSEFQRRSCKTCVGKGFIVVDSSETDGGGFAIQVNDQCPDCSEAALLRKVEAARVELRNADVLILTPGTTLGVCQGCGVKCEATEEDESWDYCECPSVRDLRGRKIAELPEASAREGLCFISDGLSDRDGRVKTVCQSGSPHQIRAFMENWAPAQGMVDVYGDPARGFAGAYVSA